LSNVSHLHPCRAVTRPRPSASAGSNKLSQVANHAVIRAIGPVCQPASKLTANRVPQPETLARNRLMGIKSHLSTWPAAFSWPIQRQNGANYLQFDPAFCICALIRHSACTMDPWLAQKKAKGAIYSKGVRSPFTRSLSIASLVLAVWRTETLYQADFPLDNIPSTTTSTSCTLWARPGSDSASLR
jgi:hypothetical protein